MANVSSPARCMAELCNSRDLKAIDVATIPCSDIWKKVLCFHEMEQWKTS